jgi:ectoine hydroxylase-related dioxygenase (phytanoyl-CoA dioxygenase family)
MGKVEARRVTPQEKEFFLENGYLCVKEVLADEYLARVQAAFETVWEAERGRRISLNTLLKYPEFIELIEHPPLLDRLRELLGDPVQLLQYDLQRQEPDSRAAERYWHRDFRFPGERPLSVNVILFLDEMTPEKGPTRVVPGSQRGEALPPREKVGEPLEGEVALPCPAGSAIFINSAIWHTGGRNTSAGLRRSVYLYYGYWWLKRFDGMEAGVHDPPWQALTGASAQRLQLLGLKLPEGYLEI